METIEKAIQRFGGAGNAEPTKEEVLDGIREAVEEMKLIKAGKLKGRPVQELLDEL